MGTGRSAFPPTRLSLSHVGAAGSQDPVVYHHPTRRSVGYFGVVRLPDGKFLYRRETGRFNGESFWEYLKFLREASAMKGRRVVMISDNAKYHRSRLHLAWREQQATAFVLDFLPPYSPELNHNRYFGFLETVIEALESKFTHWQMPNDTLRRLCAII